jgi:hypothetical protein
LSIASSLLSWRRVSSSSAMFICGERNGDLNEI